MNITKVQSGDWRLSGQTGRIADFVHKIDAEITGRALSFGPEGYAALQATIAQQQARIEALEKALRPFATLDLDHLKDLPADRTYMVVNNTRLTYGDFRTARALLSPAPADAAGWPEA